jgi:hypothetical protein
MKWRRKDMRSSMEEKLLPFLAHLIIVINRVIRELLLGLVVMIWSQSLPSLSMLIILRYLPWLILGDIHLLDDYQFIIISLLLYIIILYYILVFHIIYYLNLNLIWIEVKFLLSIFYFFIFLYFFFNFVWIVLK